MDFVADESFNEVIRGAVTIDTGEELQKKWQKSRDRQQPLRIKLGVDPTNPQLHVGHAVPLRKMRQFQDAGHQAVLIIGDYTACVGDPSGRDKTRPTLTHDQVRENAETYLQQAWKILDKDRTELCWNGDWFREMSFLEVIALCGRTTVARQLERDDFQKRFSGGLPINLHEFIYPLMQAWDSVQVKADVELGGTDQTFNLLLGRDLMRQEGLEAQVCMTLPLLVGTDGSRKMSKTYGNSIGISDSPEDIFGKTMSIPDEAMRDYYTLGTDLSLSEIEEKLALNPRECKGFLARTLVRLYHDEEAAVGAEQHFIQVFSKGGVPDEIESFEVSGELLDDGEIWIVKLVVEAGMASSNNEARRTVQAGGVKIDDVRVDDADAKVKVSDGMILRVGKRKFRKLCLA
ncbi:tyrosine--tRNA ligase [bacterium TMED181]|nr:tyrosine--tRNA ligase [Planctomycetota bacterium]OUW44123.1 MAG: tyrosine--tRNA ligase [bacterium TMED181]